MDFTHSAEHRQMRDSFAAALLDCCTLADLRRDLKAGLPFNRARWQSLSALDLAGILVPEDKGGLGLAPSEVILLAEAAGYAALPEPLITMAAVTLPALAALDCEAAGAVLDQALSGQAYVAVAIAGTTPANHAGAAASVLMLDENGAALAEAGDFDTRESLDPFRVLGHLRPGANLRHLPANPAVLAQARARGAVFAAAEMIGVAQRAVDLGAAYARERQQFGRAIGTNQAVKHLLADAQVKISFARPVVYAASACVDDASLAARARVSHAKLAAGRAARAAARAALQVHGGIGYSWEADVHILLKRAMALSEDWGVQRAHRAVIAERLHRLPLAPDTLFPTIPAA